MPKKVTFGEQERQGLCTRPKLKASPLPLDSTRWLDIQKQYRFFMSTLRVAYSSDCQDEGTKIIRVLRSAREICVTEIVSVLQESGLPSTSILEVIQEPSSPLATQSNTAPPSPPTKQSDPVPPSRPSTQSYSTPPSPTKQNDPIPPSPISKQGDSVPPSKQSDLASISPRQNNAAPPLPPAKQIKATPPAPVKQTMAGNSLNLQPRGTPTRTPNSSVDCRTQLA